MRERDYIDDEISLADVWRTLADGRWIIIAVTLSTTAIATAAAFVMTPVYRGEVLLAALDEDRSFAARLGGQLGGLASLAGLGLGSTDSQKTEAIAMLGSRALAEQYIREHELLPVLFEGIWDSENKKWLVDDPADVPTMRDAVRRFDDIRSVTEDPETGLVTLAIDWKDPVLAADWATSFVEKLNAKMRQRAIVEAEQSIKYLQEEVEKTSVVELEQAIYSLIEDQIQSIMLANVREQFAFQILDPAVVPQLDEQVRPKRHLMVVSGLMLGIILGLFVVICRGILRSIRKSVRDTGSE